MAEDGVSRYAHSIDRYKPGDYDQYCVAGFVTGDAVGSLALAMGAKLWQCTGAVRTGGSMVRGDGGLCVS